MSVTTYVIGFHPPDEEWERMKAVWDACVAAGVPEPMLVSNFFDHKPPDPRGVEVAIEATEYHNADQVEEGLEVEVEKIPKDVKVLRFINSY